MSRGSHVFDFDRHARSRKACLGRKKTCAACRLAADRDRFESRAVKFMTFPTFNLAHMNGRNTRQRWTPCLLQQQRSRFYALLKSNGTTSKRPLGGLKVISGLEKINQSL